MAEPTAEPHHDIVTNSSMSLVISGPTTTNDQDDSMATDNSTDAYTDQSFYGRFPCDLQIKIVEAIDSPRDLLSLITASPSAARLFFEYKTSILVKFLKRNLSLQALQTGVRIDLMQTRLCCTTNGHFRFFGNYGLTIDDNYLSPDLDLEVDLEPLFGLCYRHEPLVEAAMSIEWLRKGECPTAPALGLDDPYASGKALNHVRAYLARPDTNVNTLRARLYSGFFSLEAWLRAGGMNYDGNASNIWGLGAARMLKNDDGSDGEIVWANPDLMVDFSLVMVYIDEIFTSLPVAQRRTTAAIQKTQKLRELVIKCHDHLPLSQKELDWDRLDEVDTAVSLMSTLADGWGTCIDELQPTP